MKPVFLFTFMSLFSFFSVFSQETANKSKELTEKAVALIQAGKLDDAVEVGEKIVKLEKEAKSANTTSYTNALLNLARMKRDIFLILKSRLMNGQIDSRNRAGATQKAYESAKRSDDLYRQALELNEKDGRAETPQTADIKSELAWVIYNRSVSKISIDAAEKFFLESIELNEKVRGKDAEQTLFVILQTGKFYDEFDNYEKALTYYERFIQTFENSKGNNDPRLLSALRPYARILFNTFQTDEADKVVKRVEKLTQKTENFQPYELELHSRCKEAVALIMKLGAEQREEFKYFLARLKVGNSTGISSISQLAQLKRIPVKVLVDEDGKIIETRADTVKDVKLAQRAESEVAKWIVRPFIYNGIKRKMRGVLFYFEFDD